MADRRSGVQHRLTRVYLLQVVLISLATVFGVMATAKIIEHVLVKQALKREAEHFWALYDTDPEFSRPDTRHMLGLLTQPDGTGDRIPESFQSLAPGYHRVDLAGDRPIVFVEDYAGARLYLIFDERRVAALALVFGVLPLTGVLLVIYLMSFITWRKSRQLMSPLVQLAEMLRGAPITDPRAARPEFDLIETEADSEVAVLVAALEAYADRLLDFVERERQFTRDASHELRTPLAVIRANLELLGARFPDVPSVQRIEDTVGDMEALIATLLLLARSEHRQLPEERLIVNDLVLNMVERLQPLSASKNVALRSEQRSMLKLTAPEQVLSIVITNLVRNAINYTNSGSVEVIVGKNDVIVRDTGPGINPDDLERLLQPFERGVGSKEGGHGLGLAIVQRLCERFKWKLEVASEVGHGTQVRISFPAWQTWSKF
ncbi:HAMP domain-containing histidine kinase [Alcanivorax sp. JB21]|uniref:sensor histidine kinase n=1 Tax=Alcanivorax limicola TaxID=2874102 RepID=UPI001CBD967D|nr:HAMP domain-containing sensor histidine kinase [Alcanivorax limicola]MBZ2188554.1 HAMP domain-containing histidine kinase [Alcanivorax limicola]